MLLSPKSHSLCLPVISAVAVAALSCTCRRVLSSYCLILLSLHIWQPESMAQSDAWELTPGDTARKQKAMGMGP